MTDIIVVVILLVIIGAAAGYVIKAKKSGVKCIGCPAGGNCSQKNAMHDKSEEAAGGCGCGCGCHTDSK